MSKEAVVAKLTGLGWSKEQALGLAANFAQESNFNPAAVGDGGRAYGIGQWHPDRQAAFQEFAGKPIQGSSLDEQVAFADYEMRRGRERAAGERLAAATTAAEAASIVSQYYERPADRAGEARRRAMVAAKWAGQPWQDEEVPAVAPARLQIGPGGANDYPVLPTYRGSAKTAQAGAVEALVNSNSAQLGASLGTPQDSYDQQTRAYDQQVEVQAKRDATGFGDVFQTSRHDPRDQALFTVLDRLNGEKEVPPPGWSYMANKDQIEAGLSDDEREYMRENVNGPNSLAQAQGQIMYRRGLDETYNLAGGWTQFLGRMAGGMMDPVGFAAGVGTGKLFQLAGIGSGAAIKAGRPALAVASQVGEGALGNVALEGIQDAMGEVKTSADYAMAASLGAIITAPFTRGTYAAAAAKSVQDISLDLQARAVREQADKVMTYRQRTGETDPSKIAQGVEREEYESIQRAVDEGSNPDPIRDQAIPGDVQQAIRQAHEEGPPAPQEVKPEPPPAPKEGEAPAEEPLDWISKGATTDPTKQVKYEDLQLDLPKIEETMLGTSGERQIPAADGKRPVSLKWSLDLEGRTKETTYSVKEVLGRLADGDDFLPLPQHLKGMAKYLQSVISDDVKDVRVHFDKTAKSGVFNGPKQEIRTKTGHEANAPLDLHLAAMDPFHYEMVLHEIVHATTHSKIEAFLTGNRANLDPSLRSTLQDFENLFERYKAEVKGLHPEEMTREKIEAAAKSPGDIPVSQMKVAFYRQYGTKNLHEFATMAMTNQATRLVLKRMDGNPVAGKPSSAWVDFISAVARMLGFKKGMDNNAWVEATALVDRIISADGSNIKYRGGEPTLNSPALFNGQGQRKYAAKMYQHAQNWLASNPIDTSKLRVITAKLPGGLSDGLVLASSKNPILQMVSGLVTETTTGAAGRRANASVRTAFLHRRLVGNAMLDYDNSFTTWGKQNGSTLWDSVMHGQKRREFDRLVYGEILDRKSKGYGPRAAPEVREAADSLEKLFERSRLSQIEAGTLGSGNLPDSSRGYVPQALDGAKLQTLSVQEMAAFHDELSAQFQQRLGWDKAFADTFAPYYTNRIRKRAQGSKEVDAMAAGGDTMQTVRDTLDEMAVDPSQRDRMTAAYELRAGIGNTKKRLDIDLRREFVAGRQMLDVYVDDPLILARTYARRVAGNVALTEQGILGIRGVRELREAAALPQEDGTHATKEELEAFDRVTAEILGTPAAGQVVSAGASNLMLLVNLQRLGGLVFTQAAEQFNMLHHLGLRSTLAGIGALPRMFGEVGRLKKGAPSGNSILTSIEAYGGEIGMDSYKMVAPLDPPEARLEDYVKQSGILTRILRAGGHAQAKISFFRGLMSAQHRAAAEQITMRAARFIRDGGDDIALRDMGFTPDVVASMKQDLANVAQWDGNGNLVSFDLTQVTDPRTAEAFVQAVHRGTSQIIQGTFIGERSKWMHNDYMRLMLQLRTFGLTATEKQLQRTAMIHGGGFQGYAYVGGLMIGQMALAMPIHAARVNLAAAGREDREKYIKDNLSMPALVRASMNYSSISGSTGDILELTANLAGGWGDAETKEMLGARNAVNVGVGKLVPAAGSVDSAFKVLGGKSDLHTALRQLPFSNLPYIAPMVSLTKDD